VPFVIGKGTDGCLRQRLKGTAFLAGFRRRFMPQNKFCGCENPAFQAKKVFNSRTFSFSGNYRPRNIACGFVYWRE
jgi:hypothetical protein